MSKKLTSLELSVLYELINTVSDEYQTMPVSEFLIEGYEDCTETVGTVIDRVLEKIS
jgi:hypothetical protein